VGEAAPGHIAPISGNVLVERIMLQVALIQKCPATLPCQGRNLPCLILRQQLYERIASLLVLRREEKFQTAFAFDEFVLFCGAAFKNAHEVLDAFLTGRNNFSQADLIGHMADYRQVLLVRFRRCSQISVVRDDRLDLDEIHALSFQGVHSSNGGRRGGDRDRTRKPQFTVRQISVKHGAGNDHAWPDNVAARNLFSPFLKNGNVPTHVTYTGYTVGDEKGQNDFASARKPIAERGVDVHIPEPRQQVLPGSINYASSFRRLEAGAAGNRRDAISSNDNRAIGFDR